MGIGEACATALAAEGATLVLVSRTEVQTTPRVTMLTLLDR